MEARGASKDLHHQQNGRHGGVAALDLIACQDDDKLSIVVVTTVHAVLPLGLLHCRLPVVIVVKAA